MLECNYNFRCFNYNMVTEYLFMCIYVLLILCDEISEVLKKKEKKNEINNDKDGYI